jgi:transposase
MLLRPRKWPKYNAAQVHEPENFPKLLHELCAGINEPAQPFGRPAFAIADMLFAMVLKVYLKKTARKVMDELGRAHKDGLISKMPCYNSLLNYVDSETVTPYLRELVVESSKVMAGVETVFAVDSTGLSIRSLGPWMGTRFKKHHLGERRAWLKVHVMCGVLTKIITAVEISHGSAGDSPFFKLLYKTTAEHFQIREVSADKAYSSLENMRLVAKGRGILFCPFKQNANPEHRTKDPLWKFLYHLFSMNSGWFYERYHKRSNVESVFSMIKRKYGEYLWSRTRTAQVNEALCKVLCHNLCVINDCIFEMDLEPEFWAKNEEAKAS